MKLLSCRDPITLQTERLDDRCQPALIADPLASVVTPDTSLGYASLATDSSRPYPFDAVLLFQNAYRISGVPTAPGGLALADSFIARSVELDDGVFSQPHIPASTTLLDSLTLSSTPSSQTVVVPLNIALHYNETINLVVTTSTGEPAFRARVTRGDGGALVAEGMRDFRLPALPKESPVATPAPQKQPTAEPVVKEPSHEEPTVGGPVVDESAFRPAPLFEAAKREIEVERLLLPVIPLIPVEELTTRVEWISTLSPQFSEKWDLPVTREGTPPSEATQEPFVTLTPIMATAGPPINEEERQAILQKYATEEEPPPTESEEPDRGLRRWRRQALLLVGLVAGGAALRQGESRGKERPPSLPE